MSKMLKYLVIVVTILSGFSVKAQTPTPTQTRFPALWIQYRDTASRRASDTLCFFNQPNTSDVYYYGNSGNWKKLAFTTGSGSVLSWSDTGRLNGKIATAFALNKVRDSLQTNITGKLNISDTAAMLSGHATKAETLTGKTISGSSNTLSNIANSSLTNSSITINGVTISLGSSGNVLNGTGFVKVSGTTISYDNTTYNSGSGTTNTLVKYTGTNTQGNSIITDNGSLVTITSPSNGTIFGLSRASGAYVWKYNIDGSTSQLRIKNNGDSIIQTYNPNGNVDFTYNITANAATLNGGVIEYSNPTFHLTSQGSGNILKLTRNTNAYDWNFNIDGTSSDFYVTNNANATAFSLTTAGAPYFASIPSYGSAATNFVTSVSGQLQQRTAAQVRSDIGAGTGSVTTVSVTTANGVSGSVSNPTSTPAISLTLGDITPSSVSTSGNATVTGTFKVTGNSDLGNYPGSGYALTTRGSVNVDGGGVVASGNVIAGGYINASSYINSVGAITAGDNSSVSKNQNATTEFAVSNTDNTNTTSRSSLKLTSGTVITNLTSISTLGSFLGAASNHPLALITNGNSRITVSSSGNVQFNNYGAGTLTTDASGNITASSDSTLKNIIRPVDSALLKIASFKPAYFKWRAKTGYDTVNVYVSFIAQSVKESFPEGVGKSKDGTLTLQDRAVLALSIKAIQELKLENDNKQLQIDNLQSQIDDLKAEFYAYKQLHQ